MTTDTGARSVRYTIDIATEAREELAAMATDHGLTQGEVIEVLLEHARQADKALLALRAKREAKIAARVKRRQLMSVLKKMKPEQLAELEAMAAAS